MILVLPESLGFPLTVPWVLGAGQILN